MEFPEEATSLQRLVRGEDLAVTFLTPLMSTAIAALSIQQRLAGNVEFERGAASYADTVGLKSVLAGQAPPEALRKGTYSPLARLNSPGTVERCTSIVMDFVYPALGQHQPLALQVGRVLGELHDNVASHARGIGFSAAQQYAGTTLRFAVVDCGRGMLSNVRLKVPDIQRHVEAIDWCLERGHTTADAVEGFAQYLMLPVAGTGGKTTQWSSTERLEALAKRLGI